jgi:acetyl-CoA carboxylase carboxyl transferase subunit beta
MSWFKRVKEGITTKSKEKKYVPDGLWNKCPRCKSITPSKDLDSNAHVCPSCQFHFKIDSSTYFNLLFDESKFKELFDHIESADPLSFFDTKSYKDRVSESQKKSGLKDALRVATGRIGGTKVVISCMDFGFIGGSMGSVVGEKISKSVDYAIEHQIPLIIISKSGGARMMEAAFSLMQMAKTSAKLALLNQQGLPYFSILTDPTTGGVTASFAMLGDVNISEPEALIGFAGPRVIKETIGKDLPKGFQSAEFLLEHGFVDFIVHRTDMKDKLSLLLKMVYQKKTTIK